MDSVIYITAIGDSYAPNVVYNPDSKASLEELSDAVLNILLDKDAIALDDVNEWNAHPAYIATVDGDLDYLKDLLKPYGYQIREIPVA